MSKKDKEVLFIERAINKMLEIAGHNTSYDELLSFDNDSNGPWYSFYTMTEDQMNDFKSWFLLDYKSTFKRGKYRSEKDFAWFLPLFTELNFLRKSYTSFFADIPIS